MTPAHHTADKSGRGVSAAAAGDFRIVFGTHAAVRFAAEVAAPVLLERVVGRAQRVLPVALRQSRRCKPLHPAPHLAVRLVGNPPARKSAGAPGRSGSRHPPMYAMPPAAPVHPDPASAGRAPPQLLLPACARGRDRGLRRHGGVRQGSCCRPTRSGVGSPSPRTRCSPPLNAAF